MVLSLSVVKSLGLEMAYATVPCPFVVQLLIVMCGLGSNCAIACVGSVVLFLFRVWSGLQLSPLLVLVLMTQVV